MLDWRKNLRHLVSLVIVAMIAFAALKYGIAKPLKKQELMGKTQQQVQSQYGTPSAVLKNPNGNQVWVYHQTALILPARTDIEFRNGTVVEVVAYSSAK